MSFLNISIGKSWHLPILSVNDNIYHSSAGKCWNRIQKMLKRNETEEPEPEPEAAGPSHIVAWRLHKLPTDLFLLDEILESAGSKQISLREAAGLSSVAGKQGFIRCSCKLNAKRRSINVEQMRYSAIPDAMLPYPALISDSPFELSFSNFPIISTLVSNINFFTSIYFASNVRNTGSN